jgi:hypothetical protein
VFSAAFSPDGKRIVTADFGGTANVVRNIYGMPIVTAPIGGTASVWDVFPDTQSLESAAKAAVLRCLTPEQRKTFLLPPEPPSWCIEMAKQPYNTPAWEQWLADKRAGKAPPLPTSQ